MIWVQFLISSAILVVVGLKLAEFADVIAIRTGMGGLFVGAILLAASTSLPELLTTLNSFQLGEFNLAAGNLFGSNMFNMFMLGVLDVLFWRQSVLRRIRLRHALSGTAASFLIALVLFFLLADINTSDWLGGAGQPDNYFGLRRPGLLAAKQRGSRIGSRRGGN